MTQPLTEAEVTQVRATRKAVTAASLIIYRACAACHGMGDARAAPASELRAEQRASSAAVWYLLELSKGGNVSVSSGTGRTTLVV